MFGDLRTLRAASPEGLEARVREFGRFWYPKKTEAAVALVRHYMNTHSADGDYSVNFLLQPYGELPVVVRPANDAVSLKLHLLDRKLPTLIVTLILGLLLVTLAGLFTSLEHASDMQTDFAVVAFVGMPVVILLGGFWLILRRRSRELRDQDGF